MVLPTWSQALSRVMVVIGRTRREYEADRRGGGQLSASCRE
jgi:hypothetical protein